MTRIATLGPSVRLVVFQFLMKNNLIPAVVPPKRASDTPPLPPVSGVEVLPSTPKLGIFSLAFNIACGGNYELVDVWKKPHEKNFGMSFVRFVFCHRDHIKRDELFPGFIAQKEELEKILVDLVNNNLWATQGYLNPYLEKDGNLSGHRVLMLGSAGRVPNDMVFSGGRDEYNRGIGPKVLLSTLSSNLDLAAGNEVVLTAPEIVPVA